MAAQWAVPGGSEKLLKKVWKKSWLALAARHSVHMSLTAVGETERSGPDSSEEVGVLEMNMIPQTDLHACTYVLGNEPVPANGAALPFRARTHRGGNKPSALAPDSAPPGDSPV